MTRMTGKLTAAPLPVANLTSCFDTGIAASHNIKNVVNGLLFLTAIITQVYWHIYVFNSNHNIGILAHLCF